MRTAPHSLLGQLAREFQSQVAQSRLERYYDRPDLFIQECLAWRPGEGPTPYQAEILGYYPQHHRVAVRGPHGLGKTALAAWLILWFALTRDGQDWKIATTASTWRQLTDFLWPEVRKWSWKLRWEMLGREPFRKDVELLSLGLKLRTGQAFAMASNEPARMEGAHADHILVVYDEAKTIPGETFDALEGALSTGETYALCISTPGPPVGRFYDIHARKPGTEAWLCRHVTRDETLAAGQMDPAWEAQMRARGENSALYRVRVLGEFAAEEPDALIPLADVEHANDLWDEWHAAGRHPGSGFVGIGLDVGRGGDSTVMALRYGNVITQLTAIPGRDTMLIAEEVIDFLDQLGGTRGGVVVVDVIGVGAGVVDRLRQIVRERKLSHRIEAFNAGEKSSYRDATGELQFANERAAMWWNLKEMLERPEIYGLALPKEGSAYCDAGLCDELTGDLATPKYGTGAGGRILVESKEQIRKRLGRSTDAGDAVAMVMYYGSGRQPSRYAQGQFPDAGWLQQQGYAPRASAPGSFGLSRRERSERRDRHQGWSRENEGY